MPALLRSKTTRWIPFTSRAFVKAVDVCRFPVGAVSHGLARDARERPAPW